MTTAAAYAEQVHCRLVTSTSRRQAAAAAALSQLSIPTLEDAHAALDAYAEAVIASYSEATQRQIRPLWRFIGEIAAGARSPRDGAAVKSLHPDQCAEAYQFTFPDSATTFYFDKDRKRYASFGLCKGAEFWVIGNIDLDLAYFPLHLKLNGLHEILCHNAHYLEMRALCPDLSFRELSAYFSSPAADHLMEMSAAYAEQPIYAAIPEAVYAEDIALAPLRMEAQHHALLQSNIASNLTAVSRNARERGQEDYLKLPHRRGVVSVLAEGYAALFSGRPSEQTALVMG